MKTVNILLVGIGGYAIHYVNALLDTPCEDIRIVGVVDPYPASCSRLQELLGQNIPIYDSMDAFYANHSADLAVISTPIQFHAEHILKALGHGSNVLCEKPLCAEEGDIMSITRACKEAGKFVDIGYQWSHSESILRLKKDILDGMYGKPLFLKNLTLWPRHDVYFHRSSSWAGKLYDAKGRAVYDSIANNATAHHLHNIFFLCGEAINTSMSPKSFEAILMRTNPIETFDTCVLSGELINGAGFLFAASHATQKKAGPVAEYIFEKGTIKLGNLLQYEEKPSLRGILEDGTVIEYGAPGINHVQKLWLAIENTRAEAVGKECCPAEAAAVHTRVISKLHHDFEIYPTRQDITGKRLEGDKIYTYAEGLDKALLSLYEGKLEARKENLQRVREMYEAQPRSGV